VWKKGDSGTILLRKPNLMRRVVVGPGVGIFLPAPKAGLAQRRTGVTMSAIA